MSWNTSGKGSHEDAQATVGADVNVPGAIKAALKEVLSVFGPETKVSVSTYGHVDQATGKGNATVSVETLSAQTEEPGAA